MYQNLLNAEFAILDFFDFLRTPWLDDIMKFITNLVEKGILWILLGTVLLFFKKTRAMGMCLLLSLAINFLLVNITIKPLVARARPFHINPAIKLIVDAPHDFSFPSGHTSASFASAMGVFLINQKWGKYLLTMAALVAFTRIYLYVHFPTDVLFGAIFGILSAFVSRYILSKTPLLG